MITEITKITDGNRIVIPAAIRKSMGVGIGDALTLVLKDDGEVNLLTQAEAARRAQQLVREHITASNNTGGDKNGESRSLVDELIAERKAEGAKGR